MVDDLLLNRYLTNTTTVLTSKIGSTIAGLPGRFNTSVLAGAPH